MQSVSQRQRDGPDAWFGATVVCECSGKKKKGCPVGFVWLRGAQVWVQVCFTVRYSCEGEMTSTVCTVSNFISANQPREEWAVRDFLHLRDTSHRNNNITSGQFLQTWQLSLLLPWQQESMLHVLTHFPDIFPAWSALHMPEMFTRAMKVGMLYLCYKQIFPFLATAVNGLPPKRHRARRGEVQDEREKEQRRGPNGAWTHGSHLITLYY